MLSVCLSVCLSVYLSLTLMCTGHIDSVTSKVIMRIIRLEPSPNFRDGIGVGYRKVTVFSRNPATSLKHFWNMKPCVARSYLDTCSWKVWRKSIQGKWQKWCVLHVTKKQRLCDSFFRDLSETHSAISLETCKA